MKLHSLNILASLFFLALIVGCTSNSTPSQVPSPIPTTSIHSFSAQPVTDETVKNALLYMDLSKFVLYYPFNDPHNTFSCDLQGWKVINDDSSNDPNKKIVKVRYDCGMAWDSKQFMIRSTIVDLEIIYNLFKNPNVNKLVLESTANFTDKYGNDNQDIGLSVTFNRETAQKINYDNFIHSIPPYYQKLLDIAESYKIHPGVLKNL
jgi:hypothetical protein